jgi:hypothetical protein
MIFRVAQIIREIHTESFERKYDKNDFEKKLNFPSAGSISPVSQLQFTGKIGPFMLPVTPLVGKRFTDA